MKTDPNDLDSLLDGAIRRADPATEVAQARFDRLVDEARVQAAPRRRRRRVRKAIIVAGSGFALGGLLIAGTSLQDYLLSRPPYVGLDPGEQRGNEYIKYVPPVGQDAGEHCDLYPEFYGLTNAELDAIDDTIKVQDWSTFGSDVAKLIPTEPDAEAAESEAIKDLLTQRLQTAVPGLDLLGAQTTATPSGATLVGYTYVCRGTW
jgi:hypothetical protein